LCLTLNVSCLGSVIPLWRQCNVFRVLLTPTCHVSGFPWQLTWTPGFNDQVLFYTYTNHCHTSHFLITLKYTGNTMLSLIYTHSSSPLRTH
jgi:hypothetical protein